MLPTPRYRAVFIAFLMSGAAAFCQSDSLDLSSDGGNSWLRSLNLCSALRRSQPAGIEWTFAYSPSDIVDISASAGAAAMAAG